MHIWLPRIDSYQYHNHLYAYHTTQSSGSKASLDLARKAMVLSFTFLELGQIAICNGSAWLTPVCVRATKIDEAASCGPSHVQGYALGLGPQLSVGLVSMCDGPSLQGARRLVAHGSAVFGEPADSRYGSGDSWDSRQRMRQACDAVRNVIQRASRRRRPCQVLGVERSFGPEAVPETHERLEEGLSLHYLYERISLGQPGAAEQSMRFGLAQPPSPVRCRGTDDEVWAGSAA